MVYNRIALAICVFISYSSSGAPTNKNLVQVTDISNIDTIASLATGSSRPITLIWDAQNFKNDASAVMVYDALKLLDAWRVWISPEGRILRMPYLKILFVNPPNSDQLSSANRAALFNQWFFFRGFFAPAGAYWDNLIESIPQELSSLAPQVEYFKNQANLKVFEDIPLNSREFLDLLTAGIFGENVVNFYPKDCSRVLSGPSYEDLLKRLSERAKKSEDDKE